MARGIVFAAGIIALLITSASGLADHDAGCVTGGADPSTYTTLELPGVGTLYVEERGVPAPANTNPPVPGSGFLLGEGTWGYQESNDVPGLQRGGCGGVMWTPAPPPGLPVVAHPIAASNACTPCFPAEDPCICCSPDWINDENCGHGPDTLRF